MQKNPSIADIFEIEPGNSFSSDAVLYQQMLTYQIESNSESFKQRALYRWLVRHNWEFYKEYERNMASSKKKTNINTIISRKKDRLDARFEVLKELNLIQKVGEAPAEKIPNLMVDLFSLTDEGRIVAHLAQSFIMEGRKDEKLGSLYPALHDALQSYLSRFDNVDTRFTALLFQKCNERKVFIKAMELIVDYLMFDKPTWDDLYGVINFAPVLLDNGTIFEQKFDLIHYSYDDAIRALDSESRHIFRYAQKWYLEGSILERNHSGEWEKLWIKHMDDNASIVLYGYCRTCSKYRPRVITIGDEHYDPWWYIGKPLFDCKDCGSRQSVTATLDNEFTRNRNVRITSKFPPASEKP